MKQTLLLTVPMILMAGVRLDVYPAPGRLHAVEYDVVLSPGTDPGSVALRFDGAARIAGNGDLLVRRRDGSEERHSAPVTYQVRDGGRVFVESRFAIRADGSVGFETGSYDRSRELVIDPVVTASRYFDLPIQSHAVDNAGNVYLSTLGSNALQKVSPLGVVLSTTVPFPEDINAIGRIALDPAGNVYIAKQVTCPANATAVIGSVPGGDIVVAKLNPDLTTRAYTLCFRPGPFDALQGLVVDGTGAAYVAGTSSSDTIPATGNFGSLISGKSHLFVFKVNPAGNNLVYSVVTGNDIQSIYIAVENNGNAYVSGMTGPQFEPRQAFRPTFEGGAFDAFLLKILPNGTNIPFATFLGGGNAMGVAVDGSGNPVVAVAGASLPVVGPFSTPNASGFDQYLAKFSPDGQQLLLGTYLNGTPISHASYARMASRGNDIYLTGDHVSNLFPLVNPLTAPSTAGTFVVKFDSQFRRVLSTKFGGSEGEQFNEIEATRNGFVLLGRTFSTDLPARVNSLFANEDGYVAFVAESADLGIQVLRKTNQHRVTITNFGQENATEVRLTGLFTNNPIISTSVPCSTINIGAASNLECQFGTLLKNATTQVIVTTGVAASGSFSVSSALKDPNGGNNQ